MKPHREQTLGELVASTAAVAARYEGGTDDDAQETALGLWKWASSPARGARVNRSEALTVARTIARRVVADRRAKESQERGHRAAYAACNGDPVTARAALVDAAREHLEAGGFNPTEARAVRAWLAGETLEAAGRAEGITKPGQAKRLQRALSRVLRAVATV